MAGRDAPGSFQPGETLARRAADAVAAVASRVPSWPTGEAGRRPQRARSDGGIPEAADGQSPVPPDAFVSKDERVRRLLDDNGGRIRQPEVVEATDWSKATVSRLLSEMESRGEIERFRVGREKVVCLPEQVPDAVANAAD